MPSGQKPGNFKCGIGVDPSGRSEQSGDRELRCRDHVFRARALNTTIRLATSNSQSELSIRPATTSITRPSTESPGELFGLRAASQIVPGLSVTDAFPSSAVP